MENSSVKTVLGSSQPVVALPSLGLYFLAKLQNHSLHKNRKKKRRILILTLLFACKIKHETSNLLYGGCGFYATAVIMGHLATVDERYRIGNGLSPPPQFSPNAFDVETAGLICSSEVQLIRSRSLLSVAELLHHPAAQFRPITALYDWEK